MYPQRAGAFGTGFPQMTLLGLSPLLSPFSSYAFFPADLVQFHDLPNPTTDVFTWMPNRHFIQLHIALNCTSLPQTVPPGLPWKSNYYPIYPMAQIEEASEKS